MGSGVAWTEDAEALLRKLHRDGLTQRQIAAQLGRTHDSVARKMRGLRLVQTIGRPPRQADGHFARQKPEKVQRVGLVSLPPLASLQDVD